jgi:hypothetical protein
LKKQDYYDSPYNWINPIAIMRIGLKPPLLVVARRALAQFSLLPSGSTGGYDGCGNLISTPFF